LYNKVEMDLVKIAGVVRGTPILLYAPTIDPLFPSLPTILSAVDVVTVTIMVTVT
jgi:hypothetical protein